MFVNSPNAIDGNRIDKCDTSAAKFRVKRMDGLMQ